MNLTDIPNDIEKLLDLSEPTYWHDIDTDWYYLFDKQTKSWIRTTECPFDPEFIKRSKVTQLDKIEAKLDKILNT